MLASYLLPRLFCPLTAITRAQDGVLLLRTLYGASYVPPAPRGRFLDVPVTSPFAPYVEAMANLGITSGCAPQLFCPETSINRAQIAVFIVQALGLVPRPTPVQWRWRL